MPYYKEGHLLWCMTIL